MLLSAPRSTAALVIAVIAGMGSIKDAHATPITFEHSADCHDNPQNVAVPINTAVQFNVACNIHLPKFDPQRGDLLQVGITAFGKLDLRTAATNNTPQTQFYLWSFQGTGEVALTDPVFPVPSTRTTNFPPFGPMLLGGLSCCGVRTGSFDGDFFLQFGPDAILSGPDVNAFIGIDTFTIGASIAISALSENVDPGVSISANLLFNPGATVFYTYEPSIPVDEPSTLPVMAFSLFGFWALARMRGGPCRPSHRDPTALA